jgi:hypothetical protein
MLNMLIFYTFWLDICKLMRIRIRIWIRIQLINFDADPDSDFYLMRMRIQVTKMMRILADRDPQHWSGDADIAEIEPGTGAKFTLGPETNNIF